MISSSIQEEKQVIGIFSFHNLFICYMFATICCFSYVLISGDKSINILGKFFSSFVAPFVFIMYIIRESTGVLLTTSISILINFIIHIIYPAIKILFLYFISPILKIAIRCFIIPICKMLIYIYKQTKKIWDILAEIAKEIMNIIWEIICFIWKNIIGHFLSLIFTIILFFINHIIDPIFSNIIIPACKFINSIRAFQMITDFIKDIFWEIFCFLHKTISAIAKICENIIKLFGELMKTCYQQIIYPLTHYFERLF